MVCNCLASKKKINILYLKKHAKCAKTCENSLKISRFQACTQKLDREVANGVEKILLLLERYVLAY